MTAEFLEGFLKKSGWINISNYDSEAILKMKFEQNLKEMDYRNIDCPQRKDKCIGSCCAWYKHDESICIWIDKKNSNKQS